MRRVDPADLWFGVVFGVIATGVFALAAIVLWDSVTNSRFSSQLLPMLGLVIGVTLVRGPIGSLGRGPRFLCWFLCGSVSFALFMFSRGEAISPALAAGMGLAWAIVDLLVELFRRKRGAVADRVPIEGSDR